MIDNKSPIKSKKADSLIRGLFSFKLNIFGVFIIISFFLRAKCLAQKWPGQSLYRSFSLSLFSLTPISEAFIFLFFRPFSHQFSCKLSSKYSMKPVQLL